jgi:hypothetical protein
MATLLGCACADSGRLFQGWPFVGIASLLPAMPIIR